MNKLRILSLLVIFFLLSGPYVSALEPFSFPVESDVKIPPTPPSVDKPVVAHVFFADQEDLNQLARRVDIWEVNRAEGYLVAMLSPDQYSALVQAGYRVAIDAEKTDILNRPQVPLPGQTSGIPGYPCYRTVEETYTSMQNLAVAHPNLAQWLYVGDSWEKVMSGGLPGYSLYVLKLTNQNVPGPKPRFFLMAEIHAREYATAELAARFAESLVNSYDIDPDVTWLLDYHEVHILVMVNPDGRKHAETGEYWRKNTDSDDGCTDPYSWGTDLNRNSSFHWLGSGSSPYACDETYRGPSAASEPETQAMQNYVLGIFPDQRGPNDTDPAPANTTGAFITLHSYARVDLFPWGWTSAPAPNRDQLQTLGRKFGYFNHYEVCQSYDPACMYATNGTSDDFAYGELGIAAYTFEVGTDFFEPCSSFESAVLPDNLPALLYAAKAARLPYMNPSGPDTLNVTAAPTSTLQGQPFQLTATADDTRYNSNGHGTEPTQNIAAARYSLDTPLWYTGVISYPLAAADGAFDEKVEGVVATVNTASLGLGRHILFVESQDVAGNWGVDSAVFFWVTASPDSAITGVARDEATGDPIDQAEVSLHGGPYSLSVTTTVGLDGVFTFSAYSGTYKLDATAFGYYDATINNVQAFTGITTTQDISLTAIPKGTIAGQVSEAVTGLALSAVVTATSDYATLHTVSDPSTGFYSLPAFIGSYTVTASAPNHLPSSGFAAVAAGLTTTLDLALDPRGTIVGHVSEALTGLPLAAAITAVSDQATLHTTSDPATGFYSLPAFGGVYTVTASAPGHVPGSASVEVSAALTTSQDFSLESQACLLLVDDDGGRPYAASYHQALTEAGYYYQTWDVATQGSPLLATLSPYQAVLWFTADNHNPGYSWYSLSAGSLAALTSYLDGGGGLLMTGHNVNHGNSASALFVDRLATAYGGSLPNTMDYTVSGGGMYAGVASPLASSVYSPASGFTPDVINPAAGASQVFTYNIGAGAGVAHDAGSYRAINLGFGVEGLTDAAQRRAVVAQGVEWLGCPPSQVGLRLAKQAAQAAVAAGAELTYTLVLTNNSLVAATGIVVSDSLPAETQFVRATAGGNWNAGGYAQWHLSRLEPMTHISFTLTVRVGDVAQGAPVVNAAYGAQAAQATVLWTAGPVTVTVSGVAAPQASFETNAPVTVGQAVVFTNTTQGAGVITYTWDLGDGSTSTLVNPTRLYSLPSLYTVTLTATNVGGISIYSAPVEVLQAHVEHKVYLPLVLK